MRQWNIYYTENVELTPMISLAGEKVFGMIHFFMARLKMDQIPSLFGNDSLYHRLTNATDL